MLEWLFFDCDRDFRIHCIDSLWARPSVNEHYALMRSDLWGMYIAGGEL